MGAMASKITSLTIVFPTVNSGVDQGKHQSSASLAFVRGIHRWPVNSPHKWPAKRKMFPFDDVIIWSLHFVVNGIIPVRDEHVIIQFCDGQLILTGIIPFMMDRGHSISWWTCDHPIFDGQMRRGSFYFVMDTGSLHFVMKIWSFHFVMNSWSFHLFGE